MPYKRRSVNSLDRAMALFKSRGYPLLIWVGLMLFVMSFIALSAASASPAAQSAEEGGQIFQAKCAGCHTIGGGRLVGPDLKDVTRQRDQDWLKRFILNPDELFSAGDPVATQLLQDYSVRMPNTGLTEKEVLSVLAYLENPGAAGAAPAALVSGPGDPMKGESLFIGRQRFTNGGTSCIACHTVGGAGELGGGALGPDLTHVVQRMGEPGLTAALKTIAFPTMVGPYQNRPLTDAELADLLAFFRNADRAQPPVAVVTPGSMTRRALQVFGIGASGAAALFGILYFFWIRQKRRHPSRLPVRKPQALQHRKSS